MASDRCGGGGRSSGKLHRRFFGTNLTSLVPVGRGPQIRRDVRIDQSNRLASNARGPGLESLIQPARRRLQGGEARIGLSAAALPDNDRAERSGFVETVTTQTLRTMSGAPQPFPFTQRLAV